MRRLGELVLRHRLMVVVGWMVIAVAGARSGSCPRRSTARMRATSSRGEYGLVT